MKLTTWQRWVRLLLWGAVFSILTAAGQIAIQAILHHYGVSVGLIFAAKELAFGVFFNLAMPKEILWP